MNTPRPPLESHLMMMGCGASGGGGTAAPAAPTSFALTGRTTTTLTFGWDALPEGVTARIMWVQHGGDWDDFIANDFDLTGTSYEIQNLTPNLSYDVRIRAEQGEQVSEWVTIESNWTKPAVPAGLVTMSSGYKAVTLDWDNQSGVTFNVYRDGALVASGLTESTHINSTPAAGVTYAYTIAAANDASGLESEQCTPVDGTSGAGSAPNSIAAPVVQWGAGDWPRTAEYVSAGSYTGDPTPTVTGGMWQSIEDGSSTWNNEYEPPQETENFSFRYLESASNALGQIDTASNTLVSNPPP